MRNFNIKICALVGMVGIFWGGCSPKENLNYVEDAGLIEVEPPDSGTDDDDSKIECSDHSILAIVRDFPRTHVDFEYYNCGGIAEGLVEQVLDVEGKPILASETGWCGKQITSPESFREWYRTIDGINEEFTIALMLEEQSPGRYVFESDSFFPLDGLGYGNEGESHNYWFTTELHTQFIYNGGETFRFDGDDDVWVFINNKLAIDIGGVHGEEAQEVDLDASAVELGITPGSTYDLDIFHAERHTSRSNFRIETTIDCFTPIIIP